jgi:hypothetical protein
VTERLRFSTLKLIAESPRAYHMRTPFAPSPAMVLGTVSHALVLGTPDVAVYDGVRRGAAWEAAKATHEAAGTVVCNATEYETADAISGAVKADPVVRELDLLRPSTTVEHRIEWDFAGEPFASTPDAYCPAFCLDLKTTRYSNPRWFHGEIMRRQYHVQAALYRLAIEAHTGYRPKESYIVAVESKQPHHVVVYRLTERLLGLGERTAHLWLEELRNCRASGTWPGYVSNVVDADVPEWDVGEEDEAEDV